MDKLLVSLIIPVYNVEKYLRKCLDSAVNQTLKNIEIIIVNDGSADSCPSIISEYAGKDSRIKVINQPNMGLSAARNNGLAVSAAPYVSFMDSDDWADTRYLEKLYEEAVRCNADIVVCRHAYVLDGSTKITDAETPGKTRMAPAGQIRMKGTGRSAREDLSRRKPLLKIQNAAPYGNYKTSAIQLHSSSGQDLYTAGTIRGRRSERYAGRREDRAAMRSLNISNKLMRNDSALRKVISDSGIHSYAWGKIYRKALFDEYGIRYPDGLYFEDMATTFKLFFHANRISVIKDCLYYYLQRKTSISKKLVPKKVYDNITAISLMRQYLVDKGVFMDYYPEYRWLCQKMFLFSAFNLFLMYVRKDRPNMFRSISRTAKEIRSLMTPQTMRHPGR